MSHRAKGGRSRSYGPHELRKAIEHVEHKGQEVTRRSVRDALVEICGLAGSVDVTVLGNAIDAFLADRERQHRRARIEALPDPARQEAEKIASTVQEAVLDILGRLYETLREKARGEVEARELDNRLLREKTTALSAENEAAEQRILELEQENKKLESKLRDYAQRIKNLEAELKNRRSNEELVATLKHAIEQRQSAEATGEGEQA